MSAPGTGRSSPAGREAGFASFSGTVLPEWIDVNGHMNVAWYDHVFDKAELCLFDAFGINERYTARQRHGVFRLERHVRYLHELLDGDAIEVRSFIASPDLRILRHVHILVNRTRTQRAATSHSVSIHIDLDRRRSTPIAASECTARLKRLRIEKTELPAPPSR